MQIDTAKAAGEKKEEICHFCCVGRRTHWQQHWQALLAIPSPRVALGLFWVPPPLPNSPHWQMRLTSVFSVFAVVVGFAQATTTISNVLPRRTLTGDVLQVADGNLLYYDGHYYLYGVRYQECPVSQQASCYNPCGYFNNSFAVYTSPDLGQNSWTLGSASLVPAMDMPGPFSSASIVYFSPFVVFCRRTGLFVMWLQYAFSQRAVATASSPMGPFTIVRLPNSTGLPDYLAKGSSVYLWVDDEGAGAGGEAYMLINLILRGNQTGSSQFVGRLSDDFTAVATSSITPVDWTCQPPAQSNPVGANSKCFQEGGGIFKGSTGVWFVLGGNGCCFCAGGADTKVWRSLAGPLGPYAHVGYLNPPLAGSLYNYSIPAQQFGVHAVYTAYGVQPLYIGLRWGSGATKRTDFQYWAPILPSADGLSLAQLAWMDAFSFDLA